MVSIKTITSCASISFWTSGSPNLSQSPLMFQVKIRNEFNRRVSLADKRHLASGLGARCWVSCGVSYLFNISFSTSDWINLAKRSFPVFDKWRPSRPKWGRERYSSFMACSRSDFAHTCLTNTSILSILWLRLSSSNVLGISLMTISAVSFCWRTILIRLPIFEMQVATSSTGTLLVPPRTTTTSSCLFIIPGARFWIFSAVAPGHGKQHASMPLWWSVTKWACPLTSDAPMILTLHLSWLSLPFLIAFLAVFVSDDLLLVFLSHFFLSPVQSFMSGANRLLVSTAAIVFVTHFPLSWVSFDIFLRRDVIFLEFLSTVKRTDFTSFSKAVMLFGRFTKLLRVSELVTDLISESATLSSTWTIFVRNDWISFNIST